MTCNQLITLLHIYRGTQMMDTRVGTYDNDIQHLIATKMITVASMADRNRGRGGWKMTTYGDKSIKTLLRLLP